MGGFLVASLVGMVAMTFLLTQWKLVLVGVLLALLGVQQVRIDHAHTEYAQLMQQIAEERQKASEAARIAEQEARDEEQRREQRKQEIIDHAEGQTELARAAASDAERAAAGLRERLASLVASIRQATRDPGPAKGGEGKQDSASLDLLANLYAKSDDRSGQLAVYADALRISGEACEASYDALTPR